MGKGKPCCSRKDYAYTCMPLSVYDRLSEYVDNLFRLQHPEIDSIRVWMFIDEVLRERGY